MGDESAASGLGRREFLHTTAAIAAGGALIFGDWTPAQAQETTLPTRTLGRTGLRCSTVSFGGIQLSQAAHRRVLEHAIDQGINLVHTSPGYTGGQSMAIVGEVMRSRRNKVILALKTDPGDLERCLRILNTDHVDILCPHRGHDGLRDAGDHQRFAAAKRANKIRWTGFATHDHQAEAVGAATAAGAWDTCLVAYNVGNRAQLTPVLADAVRRQRMGFMVMKSSQFPGGHDAPRFQANIRSLLQNTSLATLNIGLASIQHVDQCIAAVRQQRTSFDRQWEREVAACAGKLCSMCGRCAEACGEGVAVMDLLRAWNYAERGDVTLTRELVGSLPARRTMAACTKCGRCDGSCPQGIAVMDRLLEAGTR